MERGERRGDKQVQVVQAAQTTKATKDQVAQAQPWVVLINAPVTSLAHDALLSFLESNDCKVQKIIFMGAAAAVSRVEDKYGGRYVEFVSKSKHKVELLVCGMAAKNYGVTEDQRNHKFELTGFMEILNLIHKAKSQNCKVLNW